MFSGDGPLTGPERALAEFQKRYDIATGLLGADTGGRLVFRILYLDPRGWSVSALANEVSKGENTIRRIYARNESRGYMARENGTIFITAKGAATLEWVERETCRIATGQQAGFSPQLIRRFAEVGVVRNGAKAATIRFDSLRFSIQ